MLLVLEGAIKAVFVVAVVAGAVVPMAVYFERKISAWIQDRTGPNRVGPWGLLQALVDVIKFFFKEDIIPSQAHKVLFLLAPCLMVFTSITALAVLPMGDTWRVPFTGHLVNMVVADVDIGILWMFAMTSLGVYGIILAGWASSNHFAFMGGLRSSAQIISYELGMSFAVLAVLVHSGSLRLKEAVFVQDGLAWHAFTMPIAFVIFFVSMFAETNRLPFDLPEADSELIAGYHTEYSSMKFAMFFMSEYIAMVSMSGLLVTFFLGGWRFPGVYTLLDSLGLGDPVYRGVADFAVFWAKLSLILLVFIWTRWTLPRFRYDQLMNLGWKVFLPLSLVQVLLAAVWRLFGPLPYALGMAVTLVLIIAKLWSPRRIESDARLIKAGTGAV